MDLIMGEIYQFKCLECDLEFKLGRGVGGSNAFPSLWFYCEKCKKVSYEHNCEYCKRHLKRIVYPLKGNLVDIYEEEGKNKVNCPHCYSSRTFLDPLNKWMVDYQVW